MYETRSKARRSLVFLAILCLALAGSALAQETPPTQLRIDAPKVTPEKPGVDTLCQLRVTLHNDGELPASALAFEVKINGEALVVYGNQVYMQAIPAKGSGEVRLFNFWTTETRRKAPKDGVLKLEVRLLEASWMTIEDDEEGVEVWTPQGAVEGLPIASGLDVPLAGLAKEKKAG